MAKCGLLQLPGEITETIFAYLELQDVLNGVLVGK